MIGHILGEKNFVGAELSAVQGGSFSTTSSLVAPTSTIISPPLIAQTSPQDTKEPGKSAAQESATVVSPTLPAAPPPPKPSTKPDSIIFQQEFKRF